MDEEITTIVNEHGWFFANVSDAAIPDSMALLALLEAN